MMPSCMSLGFVSGLSLHVMQISILWLSKDPL